MNYAAFLPDGTVVFGETITAVTHQQVDAAAIISATGPSAAASRIAQQQAAATMPQPS